jgi:5-methyltetrahydrofolate--homocysteine methyltransferase
METRVSTATKEVAISDSLPTVLIGERINPSGRKRLAAALRSRDMEFLRREALAQVRDGADILDVNVGGVPGVDEAAMLPQVVRALMDTVDVPLCLDSHDPRSLAAALQVYRGKPIVNSVTGEERSLKEILPLAKEYSAAVVGLTIDDNGIPKDSDQRLSVACKIVERAESLGIPRADVIIDCLALTAGADTGAGLVTLEAIRKVKAELGVNQTLGASNVSFGLPERDLLNSAFLSIAIAMGLTCPIVDVAKVRPMVLAADLALGRDNYAMRYLRAYRQRRKEDARG